ncbi:hypothetical protein ACFS07_33465 [Undibacterium arcticum]
MLAKRCNSLIRLVERLLYLLERLVGLIAIGLDCRKRRFRLKHRNLRFTLEGSQGFTSLSLCRRPQRRN